MFGIWIVHLAMVLIAIGLGIWHGWVIEQLNPRGKPIGCVLRSVLSLAFLFVALVFFHSLYARYTGHWTCWTVRLFNFLAAPAQLWPIIGFVAGWLGFRRRGAIAELLAPAPPPEQTGGETPSEEPKPKKAAAAGLLAGFVGLPLAGVLTVIAVLIFLGPELRSRLESLKFGDIEARFIAAAQKSLQTMFPGFVHNIPIAESGSGLKSQLELNGLILEEIMKRVGTADVDRDAIRAEHKRVVDFHIAVIFPFADAMSCYLKTFSQRDFDLQRKAIKLALEWKDSSIRWAGRARSMPDPDFARQVAETSDLGRAYAEAAAKSSVCVAPQPRPTPATGRFDDALPALFSNGYVIAFVANLIASTHDYEQAVEYFNAMAGALDKHPTQRPGQMHFYVKRAAAKDYARWYPRDAGADLRHARSIADDLIVTVTGSAGVDRRLALHLGKERANNLNTEVFSTVRDWHEGYRLSPDQIGLFEEAAAELQKWIKQHSPKALGDDPADDIAAHTVHLIATAYDTLALSEIAIGDFKADRSKDRCARILDHLAKSKDLFQWWSQVRIRRNLATESDYRSHFRTIDAHYQLYGSFCGQ